MNIFLPGELKLVGPDVDEVKILLYCEKVFQRCKMANVHLIVWGSGGARRIPDGFDRTKAREQFVSIASKIAKLAKKLSLSVDGRIWNSKHNLPCCTYKSKCR